MQSPGLSRPLFGRMGVKDISLCLPLRAFGMSAAAIYSSMKRSERYPNGSDSKLVHGCVCGLSPVSVYLECTQWIANTKRKTIKLTFIFSELIIICVCYHSPPGCALLRSTLLSPSSIASTASCPAGHCSSGAGHPSIALAAPRSWRR